MQKEELPFTMLCLTTQVAVWRLVQWLNDCAHDWLRRYLTTAMEMLWISETHADVLLFTLVSVQRSDHVRLSWLSNSPEGPLDIVSCLLSNPKVDVNCTDIRMTTPLHWCNPLWVTAAYCVRAAVCNRPDVCKTLAQRGAKLMFRAVNGMTALHYAIQKNHAECANLLQRLASGDKKVFYSWAMTESDLLQRTPDTSTTASNGSRPTSAISRYLR